MKKIFLTLTIFSIVISSCDRIDYGDINQNPYSPTESNIDAQMRASMISFATFGFRAGYSVPSLYAQYQSQYSYSNEQVYNQFTGSWSRYYVNCLNNLKEISNTTQDVRGDTANMRAIAELTSVLIWKRITDTFGDVPYAEALQGSANLTPAYSSQKDIYTDLIARTKAARDMIDTSAFTPDADTDIFYGGDMSKWGKFANSLLLSLTIQLTNTSMAGMAKTEFMSALSNSYGVMQSPADDLVFVPDVTGNNQNPISTQRPADYNLSKELTDALNGKAGPWGPNMTDPKNVTSTAGNTPDKRLTVYSDSRYGDGLPYGYTNYGSSMASMNDNLDSEGAPFTLFSAAYTWLNRAEASLPSVYNTGESTNTMFANGVIVSFLKSGLSVADGSSKATERLGDVAGSVTMAQVIGEEKWFALFPDGNAAWAEQRRTGYPMLQPAPQATNGGVIPHRMLYPIGESSSNSNGYSQGVAALMPADDKNTSKIWWE